MTLTSAKFPPNEHRFLYIITDISELFLYTIEINVTIHMTIWHTPNPGHLPQWTFAPTNNKMLQSLKYYLLLFQT